MITIIARWESGWFGKEYGVFTEYSFWEQIFIGYAVDRAIFVPKGLPNHKPEQYKTLTEALKNVEGRRVFLEKEYRAKEIGREPIFLREFVHPKDVVYIIGSSLTNNLKWVRKQDVVLSVDRINKRGDMFGMTMLGIVLHDRMVKELDD